MLVLRKEIKIGIGAGLAILGIAGIYGLLASVTNSGPSTDQTAVATDDTAHKLKDGVSDGLPPPDVTPAPVVTPPKPIDTTSKAGDPFAESNRTDGNPHNDVWASALSSGHIGGDVRTAGGGGTLTPTVVKAPTGKTPISSRPEGKLVNADPVMTDGLPPTEKTSAKSNKTPAATAGTTPGVAPAAGSGKYVIANGDTFSTISAKVYGSKKYYAVLVKANPDVNPSRMKVGHEISVPPKETVTSVGGAIETDHATLAAPIDTNRQYRVEAGDTLSHIASKLYGHSTMWSAIYEANKTAIGPDESKLKVGTLLDLPQRPAR